jgi:hypothetical protein
MHVYEPTPEKSITISPEDIERWFRVLEYLLFKITFFTLAAMGAYHLIVRT